MKKPDIILMVMLLIVFLSVLSGCGEKDLAEKPTTLIQTETTIMATPTPTPTPTATPTPSPTPTPEDVRDPLIAGAKMVEEGDTKILVAEDGNVYGIEEGAYIGEYKENVFCDGKQVGGWALIPSVAERVFNDAWDKVPDNELKIRIILPIDITQSDSDVTISEKKDDNDNLYFCLTCNTPVDVVNVIPGFDQLYMLWFDYNGIKYGIPIYVGSDVDANKISNETAMYFVQINISESEKLDRNTSELKSSFGDILGNSNGYDVFIGCGDESGTFSINYESLLKTEDGSLIFITTKTQR